MNNSAKRTVSDRSEYFRLRYEAMRKNAGRSCSYCGLKSKSKFKFGRCPKCKKSFIDKIKSLYVNSGLTFDEIGNIVDEKKKFTGERIRQIYGLEIANGFSEEENNCHKSNRKKKKIEEKTGKKIDEIIKIIKKSKVVFTPRKISIDFNCSWECGKNAADYLLQWHVNEISGKVMSMSKEEYLESVKIDFKTHNFV